MQSRVKVKYHKIWRVEGKHIKRYKRKQKSNIANVAVDNMWWKDIVAV